MAQFLSKWKRSVHCFQLGCALSALLLIGGCGPSIKCAQNIDGSRLFKELSDPSLALDVAAQSIVQLVSTCSPSEEQQDLIGKIIGKIASDGMAKLQADFYRKLSEQAPDSKYRLEFVEKASLFSGTAKTTQDELTFVEFEKIGTPFNMKGASPPLSAALISGQLDKLPLDQLRQVNSEIGPLVLARTTESLGFVETSEIRVFSASTGKRIATPAEEYDYLYTHASDKPLSDYFFSCESLAGGKCAVRDSRFAVNVKGHLKYVTSVLYSDHEDQKCGVTVNMLRPEVDSFKRVSPLSQTSEITCSNPPTPDLHGDPFQIVPESELLPKLAAEGAYPSLVELLNFKKKDASDTALKNKLVAQGLRWKNGLLEKAYVPADASSALSAKSYSDSVVAIQGLRDAVQGNLANLKWLLLSPDTESETGSKLISIGSQLESLSASLSKIKIDEVPQAPAEPEFPVERVSISLIREITADEPIVRFPDAPYVYLGVAIPKGADVILYSQASLANRPGVVTVLARRGLEPVKFMFQGFTRDFWVYQTLSEDEFREHQEYVKKLNEYKAKVSAYKASVKLAEREANEIILALTKLDLEMRQMVEDASKPN